MAGILDLLGPALSGGTLQQLSSAVGTDEQTTQRAAAAALPLLLGAMNRNTNSPQGAQSLANALDQDHDGGLLDNLGGFLGGAHGRRAEHGRRQTPAPPTEPAFSATSSAGSSPKCSRASARRRASTVGR